MVPLSRFHAPALSTIERTNDGQENPDPDPSHNDRHHGGIHVWHYVVYRPWPHRSLAFHLAEKRHCRMAFRFRSWCCRLSRRVADRELDDKTPKRDSR